MQYYISGPPPNPLARLLAAILGLLALVGAFFFGVFILLGALALGLIAWLVIRIRIWWFRRKYGASGGVPPGGPGRGEPGHGQPSGQDDDVIEAEYEVVSRKDD